MSRKYGFEILVPGRECPGGKYSGRRDEEGRELVWSSEHVGQQDASNLLDSRQAAEAELPNLARVLECEVSALRVVEL